MRQADGGRGSWRLLIHPTSRTIIVTVGCGDLLTHDDLDREIVDRSSAWAVAELRRMLVTCKILPERTESIVTLSRWAERRLDEADLGVDRVTAEQFISWSVLRNARERVNATGDVSAIWRRHIGSALVLLRWLQDHELALASCTQRDLDRWRASPRGRASAARAFLRWAVRTRRARTLTIPRRPDPTPIATVSMADQQAVIERLLYDDTISLDDRLAGLCVLLYGQLVSRLTRLPSTTLTAVADSQIEIRFGPEVIVLPGAVAPLAVAHLTALAAQGSVWLFPSHVDARKPIGITTLRVRLRRIGITGEMRTSTLFDLARQLPAPVLRDGLGMHGNTAARWTTAAGGSWAGYVALHPAPSR